MVRVKCVKLAFILLCLLSWILWYGACEVGTVLNDDCHKTRNVIICCLLIRNLMI